MNSPHVFSSRRCVLFPQQSIRPTRRSYPLLAVAALVAIASTTRADPTITVLTNRTAFETAVGPGRLTDDFSGTPPALPVATARGGVELGKWADIARNPEPSTTWSVPFGTTAWGGTWDLTVGGTGGGLAFDLDFGGGNVVTVPGNLAPGSAANLFFGFTADQPFFAVRVRQFDSQENTLQETHTLDDMTFQLTSAGEVQVFDGAVELTDGQAAAVDFGTVVRNSSTPRTLTLNNPSAAPLQVVGFSTSGSYTITNAPVVPFVLAAGGSTTFQVVFNPIVGGIHNGRVNVFTSDADEGKFDFSVTGAVPLEPEIEIVNTQDSAVLVNGQAGVIQIQPNPFGGGSSVSFLVNNPGLDPLMISAVTAPPGFAFILGQGTTLPRTIAPGGSLAMSLTSTGPTAGVYAGPVTVVSNDLDEPNFTFPIRALYNLPEIEVFMNFATVANGDTADFGTTPLAQRKVFQFLVKNLFSGPLTVTGISLPAGYALAAPVPTFPFSLGRNQIHSFSVELQAAAPGTYTGTLQIFNNDDDENPFELQLTGVVSEESITFFGFNTFIREGQSFGAAAVGSGAITYEWDLDDDGEFDDATGSSINLPDTDGPGSFPARLRMTDNLTTLVRTGEFLIQNEVPLVDAPFPGTVLAGSNLPFQVTAFDIPADLAAGVEWRIDWGDGELSTTAAGHAPQTTFNHAYSQPGEKFITIEATDKDGGKGSTFRSVWVHSAVIGVFDGPDTSGDELFDGLSSLSFTAPVGGSQDTLLTLLNRSASPATVGSVTLPVGYGLVNPPAFPASLAAGATMTLTLRFAPQTPGSFNGGFSLGTSDPALPAFDLLLSGNAVAPDISVSYFQNERSDFASGAEAFDVFPGTQPFNGLSIHIESTDSNAPLVIQSITLPPGFRFETAPVFPLDFSSESSLDLRIQCEGSSPGFYKGWVSIQSNDPDESPFRFFVTSRAGSIGDLLVKSDSSGSDSATGIILSGQAEAVDAGQPLTLRLRNQGNQGLTVSAITLPAGFAFATPPASPITLSAFGSVTLPELTLVSTAPGTHSGEVSITSTDPDENPYHFAITAIIPGGEPVAPELTSFTVGAATAATPATVSCQVRGAPDSVVILEGSTDLGLADDWSEITRGRGRSSRINMLDSFGGSLQYQTLNLTFFIRNRQ